MPTVLVIAVLPIMPDAANDNNTNIIANPHTYHQEPLLQPALTIKTLTLYATIAAITATGTDKAVEKKGRISVMLPIIHTRIVESRPRLYCMWYRLLTTRSMCGLNYLVK
jgi:hypothetical protein